MKLTTDKERANELYKFLYKASTAVTKEQICQLFGWEYNSNTERQARAIIALLGSKVPIIATSDRKGYKLAKSKEDIDEVRHQWAELSSRVEELDKRIIPLEKFIENHGGNLIYE